ncbi:MAG TPA: nucleotidyl transferase AbiEii/AbiGii toxin family protein, partial [Actinomycetes bacterium]
MTGRYYLSPAAFRRALTDRLRAVASTGPWTLAQLQRQFAYDRLLQRLYQHDRSWVVKGATALLARDIGVRATIDVDVYSNTTTDVAEAELRAAVAVDLHDWFRFEVGPPQPVGAGAPGLRLPIAAYLGTTRWASFHVDLVGSELRMTGQPDQVRPLASVHMPDVAQHPYAVYPLVDHIADKIVAVFRYG